MKSRKTMSVLLMLAMSIAAFTADLKNEYGVKYELKIYKDGGRVETSIDGSTTISQICSECEIEVVGVGKVKASGAEVWVIKNGKSGKQE